jgi:hypothetical protein
MFINYKNFKEVMSMLIENKNKPVIDLLLGGLKNQNYMEWSSEVNFPELTEWLFQNNYECIANVNMDTAAKNGQLDTMRWLYTNKKSQFTYNTIRYAVKRGDLDMVKFLHGKVEHTTDAMDWAASGGHLKVLKWLHLNGYGCTSKAISWAAGGGYMKTVKWLNNIGAECTVDAMDSAIINNQYEVLDWLHKNRTEGCSDVILDADELNIDIVKWLQANKPNMYRKYYDRYNIDNFVGTP